MSEPFFLRNVKTVIHDEAVAWENNIIGTALSRSINNVTTCIVSDEGRVAAVQAVRDNYKEIWASLARFDEIQMPLWIEIKTGDNTYLGCLVARFASETNPTYVIRRFTMKDEVIWQNMNPVVASWSQKKIMSSRRPLAFNQFVDVTGVGYDNHLNPELIPHSTKQNAWGLAELVIGVLSNIVRSSDANSDAFKSKKSSSFASSIPMLGTVQANDGRGEHLES